jgi:hypothetical protein
MSKYYLITLKNTRRYQARDVRSNGLPLTSLHTIVGPGRLEFTALQAAQSGAQTGLGGFERMIGIDAEFDIADPVGSPGRRGTLKGRVTSAVVRQGSASPAGRSGEYEYVQFTYERIIWMN